MDFQSLQKLRFFLSILFPGVGRNPITPDLADEWLDRHPRLKSQLAHLQRSKLGENLQRTNETFGTGKLNVDESLDWSLIPQETKAVLRAGIALAAMVCVLVPVAMMFPWPALSREAITDAAGSAVAGWSVVLWILAGARQFVAYTDKFYPPHLTVEVRADETTHVRKLLENAAIEAAQRLKDFKPTKLTRWDQFCPGALALDFAHEANVAKTTFPAMGTIVVVPVKPGTVVVFTMVFTVGGSERHWDLARTLQVMQR